MGVPREDLRRCYLSAQLEGKARAFRLLKRDRGSTLEEQWILKRVGVLKTREVASVTKVEGQHRKVEGFESSAGKPVR